MNNGNEQKSEPSVKDAIRRTLGFKALRTVRGMVDEIEREEAADRKLLRAWLIAVPLILLLAALIAWFSPSLPRVSIIETPPAGNTGTEP